MAVTTPNALPLDDSECEMLRDLVVGLTYAQGYDVTGDDSEDFLALNVVGHRFLNGAAVLAMVRAREATAETWLPQVLHEYERETLELVEESSDEERRERAFLASARALLARCEASDG